MTSELARERLESTLAFSVGFGVVVMLVAPIAGALAVVALGWAFATITLLGLCAGGLVIVFAWLSAIQDVRWMLVETVGLELDAREAEREALQGGRAMIQHTQVDARGIGNQIAVQQVPQETIRLVPFHSARKLIDGLPPAAIAFFVDQYPIRGWSQREWVDRGIRLPGMKDVCDYDTWRALLGILEKVEAIPPVRERVKIKPILDLDVIKRKALGSGLEPDDAAFKFPT